MSVYPYSSSNLRMFYNEELQKQPRNRCVKLEASYSKRLEPLIATKGALTKYLAKAVNTYAHVIF